MFESPRQTADRVAEVLIDERIEREMEQLDKLQRELNRPPRDRDCPQFVATQVTALW